LLRLANEGMKNKNGINMKKKAHRSKSLESALMYDLNKNDIIALVIVVAAYFNDISST
jgi:hypothetical protein